MWSETVAQSKESLWDAAGYGSLSNHWEKGTCLASELSLDPPVPPTGG